LCHFLVFNCAADAPYAPGATASSASSASAAYSASADSSAASGAASSAAAAAVQVALKLFIITILSFACFLHSVLLSVWLARARLKNSRF